MQRSEFRVEDLRVRVQGLGFRVRGSGDFRRREVYREWSVSSNEPAGACRSDSSYTSAASSSFTSSAALEG